MKLLLETSVQPLEVTMSTSNTSSHYHHHVILFPTKKAFACGPALNKNPYAWEYYEVCSVINMTHQFDIIMPSVCIFYLGEL